jgi:hypothetical protein
MTGQDGMDSGQAAGGGYPESTSADDQAFNPAVAHQARIYDYWLGGKDHYPADRAYADAVAEVYPGVLVTARANRAFLGRAVRFMAGEAGLAQFLDIGTGIPASGSTHEIAQDARPDARIVYVDNDPVVLAHARALLVGREPGTTDYLHADLRDPGHILAEAAKILDFSRPVGLLLVSVLHAIPDADDPYGIVAALLGALPAGSCLAITHWPADEAASVAEGKVVDLARQMSHQQYIARSHAEISRFFDGLSLVDPGLVPVQDWRPGAQDQAAENLMPWLAGVGLKPAR